MSTNMLRNTILFLGALALTCMVAVAYGSYNNTAKNVTVESSIHTNAPNTEMPWETLSRRLIGAVSF
jgi:hypothetical protein